MKKRHLQNSHSAEKRTFESNIKKYKTFVGNEDVNNEKMKLEEAPKINHFIPRKTYFANREVDEPLPSTSSSNKGISKNEDVLEMLRHVLQSQKEINSRLEKLEQNHIDLMHNQSILCKSQNIIVTNQKQIANTLENIEESVMSKPKMMAESKLMMECKVAIKNIESSVCRMTGETLDKNIDEVASMLPLETLTAVQEIEQKLQSRDFAQAMITYLHKLKGTSEDVGSIIRSLFTDDLLEYYNWEGRWEKKALAKLMLFNKILREVFQQQGVLDFEKSIRKSVERSHHRVKQKKYLKNQNK